MSSMVYGPYKTSIVFIRNEFIMEKKNEKSAGYTQLILDIDSLLFQGLLLSEAKLAVFLKCKLEMRSLKVMRNHNKKIVYEFISSIVNTHFSFHGRM